MSYDKDPSLLSDPLIAGEGLGKNYFPGDDALRLNDYSEGLTKFYTALAIPITSFFILLAGLVNARAFILVFILSTLFAISFI